MKLEEIPLVASDEKNVQKFPFLKDNENDDGKINAAE